MEPEQKPAAGSEPQQGRRVPNTDMQAEDAGTAESGNDEGRASATESSMKETSKTDAESGGGRTESGSSR